MALMTWTRVQPDMWDAGKSKTYDLPGTHRNRHRRHRRYRLQRQNRSDARIQPGKTGFSLGLESLEKWEGIFQSG